MTKIETKEQRDKAIEEESKGNNYPFYLRGTKSPANIEYIVRRAVEMAREDCDVLADISPDEILAQILEELK